ncbi:hypothetical protein [Winogradskyella marincola]|uniref:Outer membrane protein beta-barrel domain-containing protein n=1 Tax=Winogradskyella marincola TaxID=3037795 RepID=A0ABT6FZM1_9FLAO|nr:hypothetical protein [Winogradskyella sp. YYF002]MDG4715231.1 hypothetical protein [Winogradskyella sp. YYF002]
MKKLKYILLVVISMAFVTLTYAQHKRYAIKNGVGIQGGVTQFDIITDNFVTKKNTGFIGGLSASVDIPHKWYNVSYNILLSENNIDIAAFSLANPTEEFVEYKLLTAQISFLFHAKLIGSNLTLDLGPMLQYNGDLELKDSSKEGYIISDYETLLTEDISKISNFNVNGAVGLSAGFGAFRLRAQYIYGFTNILGNLNDEDLYVGSNNNKFKGNQSMIAFTAIITF